VLSGVLRYDDARVDDLASAGIIQAP